MPARQRLCINLILQEVRDQLGKSIFNFLTLQLNPFTLSSIEHVVELTPVQFAKKFVVAT